MVSEPAFGGEGIDGILATTRQALELVRAETPSGEPLMGAGADADGMVQAVVQAPGYLVGLDIDPRLLRRGSAQVAEHVASAVNTALADLRAKACNGQTGPDLDAIGEHLAELQTESIRQLERFTTAASSAIEQIRSGERGSRG